MVKRGLTILVLLWLFGLLILFYSPTQAATERRVALVIGNGAYKSYPLNNPAYDAQDMAEALRSLGFEVILRVNADRRQMIYAIKDFGKKLRGAKVGLFFYAGIIFTEPMIEGLKRAGRDLTRDNFISAMETIKGFKGVGPEVNFKPFDKKDIYSRQGTQSTFLVQCLAEGKAKKLTDWMEMH